ncbi:MAG: hypothetical protein ACYC6T_09545 [Thermoleophilia bacterium]
MSAEKPEWMPVAYDVEEAAVLAGEILPSHRKHLGPSAAGEHQRQDEGPVAEANPGVRDDGLIMTLCDHSFSLGMAAAGS